MEGLRKFDNKLSLLCLILFVWFYASNLTTAFKKAPQQDDAMFTTVAKNIVNGYGWATSYGEKIPFNPDLTAGPGLLLPAAGMITLFGTHTWTPAVTGTLLNIILSILILWQLQLQVKNKAAHFFAFLLSSCLYAVHDFRTFTGYYASAQLFIFSLLFVLNTKYSATSRLAGFGCLAIIGYLAKPLIFLSFVLASPLVVFYISKELTGSSIYKKNIKAILLIITAAGITLSPWNLYKSYQLSKYDPAFQNAHAHYHQFFFEHHGTGIAQLKMADDIVIYIYRNASKNYRILKNFLAREYNANIIFIGLLLITCFIWPLFLYKKNISLTMEQALIGILAFVISAHYLWYVLISFAMTPGHAYFPTWYSFFLLFFAVAAIPGFNVVAIIMCLFVSLLFPVRHAPLLRAFQFKTNDLYITNKNIDETLYFLKHNPPASPLASCSYQAAPWRLELLMAGSHHFLDCINLLEDALIKKSDVDYVWGTAPDFTLVLEGFNLILSGKDRKYVFEPILDSCQQHILFKNNFFVVCEVHFSELKKKLDPTETAHQLIEYQSWYRTRLKNY